MPMKRKLWNSLLHLLQPKQVSTLQSKQLSMLTSNDRKVQNSSESRESPESKRVRPYTIVVEGNIGSGKTTFLEPFAKNHGDKVSKLNEVYRTVGSYDVEK